MFSLLHFVVGFLWDILRVLKGNGFGLFPFICMCSFGFFCRICLGGGGVLPFLFIFFAVNILQTRQHSQLLAEYLDMLADCQHK